MRADPMEGGRSRDLAHEKHETHENAKSPFVFVRVFRGLFHLLVLVLLLVAGCAAIPDERAKPFDFEWPDTLRADRGHAIVFYVDGVNRDVFYEMIDAGELPTFKRYFLDRGAEVEKAVCTFPSVTTPNCVAMATGFFQGRTNVPQIRWFDRNRMLFRDYATIAQKDAVDDGYVVPTVFERLTSGWSVSILFPIHRGATRWIENWTSAGPPYFFKMFRLVDRISMIRWSIVNDIALTRGELPRVVWMHLIAPTCNALVHGTEGEVYRDSIRHADAQIGRLLANFEARGILDRLTLFLVSEHGQTVSDPGKRLDVEAVIEKDLGLRVARKHLFERTVFEERLAYYRKHEVVFATAGQRSCYLYIRKPGNGSTWLDRPAIAELRAYPTRSGPLDVLAYFAAKEQVDLAIAHEGTRVLIVSENGEASITSEGDSFRYEVVGGEDPLRYKAHPPAAKLMGGFHTGSEWLAATIDSDYPDAVAQLAVLFQSARVGDVVLSVAPGYSFRKGALAGHGSAWKEDMLMPMIVAGKGVRHCRIPHARLIDLAPTLLEAIGEDPGALPLMDGRSFWEEIRSEN